MSARKPIAAMAAVAAAATIALPVASAEAAPLSTQAISNTVTGSPAGSLCSMLGAETQGAQLFGNPVLVSRLQQTSGYMTCG